MDDLDSTSAVTKQQRETNFTYSFTSSTAGTAAVQQTPPVQETAAEAAPTHQNSPSTASVSQNKKRIVLQPAAQQSSI